MPLKEKFSPRFIYTAWIIYNYTLWHLFIFFHAVVALLLHTRSRSRRTLTNSRPAPGFFDLQIQFFSTFHYFVFYTHIYIVQLCLHFRIIYIVGKTKPHFNYRRDRAPSTSAPNWTMWEVSSILCYEIPFAMEWMASGLISYLLKRKSRSLQSWRETSFWHILRFGFYHPHHVTSSLNQYLPYDVFHELWSARKRNKAETDH